MSPRSAVPAPVTAVVEAAGGWLPRRMAAVEKRLAELTEGHGPALAEDAGATLAAGGKRLRPLLVLLCAGPDHEAESLRAGTAIELIHMATLVHDDILDHAQMRRGYPTVVARSGRPRAIATGDLLFSRAFAELTANGSREQVSLLNAASIGLALGELAQRRDAYDMGVTVDAYLERCRLKTARLFECACQLGRLAGGGAGEAQLGIFGREVGLAFQLLDDVLDVTGPPERTGKARGTDLLDGTVTLPLILAARADPALVEVDLRALDSAEAGALCDRIGDTGVLDQVRALALDRVAIAKDALEDAAFDPEERRLLGMVADGVVDRYA